MFWQRFAFNEVNDCDHRFLVKNINEDFNLNNWKRAFGIEISLSIPHWTTCFNLIGCQFGTSHFHSTIDDLLIIHRFEISNLQNNDLKKKIILNGSQFKKIPINYTSNWKLSTTSDFERVELCVSSSSGLEAEVWARLKSLREIYGLEWFIWRQLVKQTSQFHDIALVYVNIY